MLDRGGWAPWPVWTSEENLAATGLPSLDSPRVASRHTDYTIPAHSSAVRGVSYPLLACSEVTGLYGVSEFVVLELSVINKGSLFPFAISNTLVQ